MKLYRIGILLSLVIEIAAKFLLTDEMILRWIESFCFSLSFLLLLFLVTLCAKGKYSVIQLLVDVVFVAAIIVFGLI